MRVDRKDLFYSVLILIISIFFVLDLFLHRGRPATFDAPFHITNIAQFSNALKSGDFPVYWEDGFANYGLPIGIIAHQVPNYLGGVINIVLNDPVTTYNILVFAAIFLSSLFLYFFLRLYYLPLASFAGVFLFNFGAYRILNIYIRGALPEVFAALFLPLILISSYFLIKKKKLSAFFFLTLSLTGLMLTHPMMFMIYAPIYFGYWLLLFYEERKEKGLKIRSILPVILSFVISIGISAYYIIPLSLEIRYFYYGLNKNQLTLGQFMGIPSYLTERWAYISASDVFPRAHIIQSGLVETLVFVLGLLFSVGIVLKKKVKENLLFLALVVAAILYVFFTSEFSLIFYQKISTLSNIQYPWRMIAGFAFLVSIIAAWLFSKFSKLYLVVLFIAIIAFLRFPQLYGKNYYYSPPSDFYSTKYNIHSELMNTIWMGKPEDYPLEEKQGEIIGGQGEIVSSKIRNSKREYQINAKTPIRMVDFTFYFHGWRAYVDGKRTPIQFQDPNYRGVITYDVPAGEHKVKVVFGDSIVRLPSKLISIFFIGFFILTFTFRKKLATIFYR